jgi:hypothetical protein
MRLPVALCLLFLLACRSKTAVPEDIISIKQMTSLMWDLSLADALVSHRYPAASEAKKLDTSVVLYQQIAKAHGTTQQQLKRSLQFYESRPDLLQIIIDSLQRRALLPGAAHKVDSTVKKRILFKNPMTSPSRLP